LPHRCEIANTCTEVQVFSFRVSAPQPRRKEARIKRRGCCLALPNLGQPGTLVQQFHAAILDLPATARYRASKMSALLQTARIESDTRPALRNLGKAITPSAVPPLDLRAYYDILFAAQGPQHWWPGRTPFEIIVGAILVQNTSWTNVARAIENLRRAKLLNPRAIENVPAPRLARLIRSSGCYRQKTKKLKNFVRFLRREYQGSLAKMFRAPTATLRDQLLAVIGIGPETADSILLYAGERPVFVIDAYTRRVLERHGLAPAKLGYEDLRQLFELNLAPDSTLYNEFHALIVHTGKHFCRPREPRCGQCPLHSLLPAPNTLVWPDEANPVAPSGVRGALRPLWVSSRAERTAAAT
jgi:endonuclease III related protein